MTEEQPKQTPRPKEEIQKEFLNACAIAGELSFQVEAFKQKLQGAWQKISDLNIEAQELSKIQKTELKDVSNGQAQS